jgi:uncharacterized RDD family membrane protein YckC/ribosomal protein L40E
MGWDRYLALRLEVVSTCMQMDRFNCRSFEDSCDTMYCRECGAENGGEAVFCRSCGARLVPETLNGVERSLSVGDGGAPQVEYAGFWLRFGAYLIDSFLLLIVYGLLVIPAVLFVEDWESAEAGVAVLGWYIAVLIVTVAYFTYFESSAAQATPGKRAVGIFVTDRDGNRITGYRAFGRYWARVLSFLILYLGVLLIGFTDRKEGLHDILAGTLVYRQPCLTTFKGRLP